MTSIKQFKNRWIKATTFGFMTFLLMIPLSFILLSIFRPPELEGLTIPEIFQQSAERGPLAYGWDFYLILQAMHFVHYVIVGTVLGLLQYKLLKEFIPNKLAWISLTSLGLVLILLGDLVFLGLSTGGAPGPLEPLLIGLGGGSLIALMQHLYLRTQGITSGKWVLWWILGIVIGIFASAILIIVYEYFLADSINEFLSPTSAVVISWLSFILPYFTLIGLFAGLFSARPLYIALEQSKPGG